MKRLLAAVTILLLCAVSAWAANYQAVKVCDGVLINASSVNSGLTDCTVVDTTQYHWFAAQTVCVESSGSDAPTYDVFFVAAGDAASTLAAPVVPGYHNNGTVTAAAVAVIYDDITAETWQAIKQVPISLPVVLPRATLRFLNNEDQADVTCSAWLYMAD